MMPALSTLKTPAETPASTASVSRRLVSSSLLASMRSPRCCSIWLAMRLNERVSWPSSSLGGPSSTRAVRSPPLTRSAAAISPPIGSVSREANRTASHTAANSIRSAIAPQTTKIRSWLRCMACSICE